MRSQNRSHRVPSKFSNRFMTAYEPLPGFCPGDAKKVSSGGGITDGQRIAANPLAAIQVQRGARAPPSCLIVRNSMPGCDLHASFVNRSPTGNFRDLCRRISGAGRVPGPQHCNKE